MDQLYYHGTPLTAPPQLTVSNFPPFTPVNHPLTNSSQNNTTTPMQCDHQNKTYQNRYSFRLSSTSEDEQDDINNKIQWQQVRSSKRKRVERGQETAETKNAVEINNRFDPLTIEETSNQNQETTNTKHSRPPPIYVYGVINYPNMIVQIREQLEDEQYNTKSLINNTVKINCTTPDSYRKLVRYFKQENIVHHTHQPKEDRA
jgi:hypothetical protein